MPKSDIEKNPIISVIIPVYNVEDYLRECLDSVVNQTYKNLEIVCVNDGSEDSSPEILAEYAAKDERIKIVNKENGGLSSARNAGLNTARGKYVYFLDSDDTIRSDAMRICSEISDREQLDVLYFDAEINYENEEIKKANPGIETYYIRNVAYNGVMSGTEIFSHMVPKNDYKPSVCIQFINRSYIEDNNLRFEEGILFEDNVFSLRLMLCAKRTMHVVERLFFRRLRADSIITSEVNFEKIYYSYYAFSQMKKELEGFELDQETLSTAACFLTSYKPWICGFYDGAPEAQRQLARERMTEPELAVFDRIVGASGSPKISVIMPIFNMAEYLHECIDSVLSQTLFDIEILCVDDGSTDNSADIVKQYCDRDRRIVYKKQDNQGVAAARNNGVKAANGEFVCFIDPDDFYPDMRVLEDLYTNAKKSNVKICGGSFSYFHEGEEEIKTEFDGVLWGYTFCENRLWVYRDYQFDYGFHRFIYDREMLCSKEIFFPPYTRFQDPPFLVKAMVEADKFYALSRVSYRYREAYKEVKWDVVKVISVLNGAIDNLMASRENNLADLHALTLRRLESIYTPMEYLLFGEQASEIIDLLFKIGGCIDEEMVRNSRFPDADINFAQKRITAALAASRGEGKTITKKKPFFIRWRKE